MNKKFTKLIAALALLTFFAVPMGMRGQSRESITASYGWEDADDASQWTISSAIVKSCCLSNESVGQKATPTEIVKLPFGCFSSYGKT